MSENTILYALYRMGYHSHATGHGFRSSALSLYDRPPRSLSTLSRRRQRGSVSRSDGTAFGADAVRYAAVPSTRWQ